VSDLYPLEAAVYVKELLHAADASMHPHPLRLAVQCAIFGAPLQDYADEFEVSRNRIAQVRDKGMRRLRSIADALTQPWERAEAFSARQALARRRVDVPLLQASLNAGLFTERQVSELTAYICSPRFHRVAKQMAIDLDAPSGRAAILHTALFVALASDFSDTDWAAVLERGLNHE
jgi:hypothetical protein